MACSRPSSTPMQMSLLRRGCSSRARLLLVGLALPRGAAAYRLQHTLRLPQHSTSCARHLSVQAAALDFAKLGVSPSLLPSLDKLGFERPTYPQSQAFPAVLTGDDVVVLAETGTGKTLAYSLPILHQMIEQCEQNAAAGSPARPDAQALVLVPNRELCAQAVSMVQRLLKGLPHRLTASTLSDDTGDPDADVVFATPASAMRYWRGPERFRWLVLDEADILLAGSFKPAARMAYPVEKIIAALKRDAKEVAVEAGEYSQKRFGGDSEEAKARRRALKAASWKASTEAFKQFLVVGATMPNAGTLNAEGHVQYLFPQARH